MAIVFYHRLLHQSQRDTILSVFTEAHQVAKRDTRYGGNINFQTVCEVWAELWTTFAKVCVIKLGTPDFSSVQDGISERPGIPEALYPVSQKLQFPRELRETETDSQQIVSK